MNERPLCVAVCTARSPRAIEETLRSIVAEGDGARVVLVTSGLDESAQRLHEQSLHRHLPAADPLHEPLRGLSRARNRALSACSDEEVICFVDDDAVLGPEWLAEMRGAWARADESVACIGGPIRARFLQQRPAWMTDAMLGSLSILDYGDRPLTVDPDRQALYGANMSFCCARLRQVGGFDLELGAGTPRKVGEDDEAQREIVRAGWRVRYEPRPFVWHLIPGGRLTPTEIVRRRARYGTFLGRARSRPRRLALRRCLSSGRHLAAALLRRDFPLTVEWAANLGENVGVLAAPFLSRTGDGR